MLVDFARNDAYENTLALSINIDHHMFCTSVGCGAWQDGNKGMIRDKRGVTVG